MGTLEKQHPQSGTIETWKQLYQSRWEIAFAETMYLIAEQYHMELNVTVEGKTVPSPTLKFWRESLAKLSPEQMRQGLLLYMKSERRSFKPTPGDLEENAPEANDKPRKVKDPKCPQCSGTGFRTVLVDSLIHEGQKARRVTDCYCVEIKYDGQTFKPEQKALPAAPEIDADELLKRIMNKTGIEIAAKGFPARQDLDFDKNAEKLQRQKEQLLKNS